MNEVSKIFGYEVEIKDEGDRIFHLTTKHGVYRTVLLHNESVEDFARAVFVFEHQIRGAFAAMNGFEFLYAEYDNIFFHHHALGKCRVNFERQNTIEEIAARVQENVGSV